MHSLKLLCSFIAATLLVFSDAVALASDSASPFELTEISSLSVSQLWHTPGRHSILENKNVVIRHTSFHQGARADLGYEKVPVVMILLGRNRTNYDPHGYALFTDNDGLFSFKIETPAEDENAVFHFQIRELECDICKEGQFSIIDDGQRLYFKSNSVILNVDR